MDINFINKAFKLLNINRVREPYYIQISIYSRGICKYLDGLGKKEIDGTNVIYQYEDCT